MTATQYRKLLDQLGLTIVGASPVLGISLRQAQRLASGESVISGPIAKLVQLMVKHNIKPDEVTGLK